MLYTLISAHQWSLIPGCGLLVLPLLLIGMPPHFLDGAGMALATLFVTMPFVVRELIPILDTMDLAEEEAARTMGATDWQVFWNVTLPNIRYGLLYGIILTNAVGVLFHASHSDAHVPYRCSVCVCCAWHVLLLLEALHCSIVIIPIKGGPGHVCQMCTPTMQWHQFLRMAFSLH